MGITDPREAWARYQDAQKVLEDEYKDFWIQKFAAEGIHFQKQDYRYVTTVGQYEVEFYVYPRQFEGAKLVFYKTGDWVSWRKIKVMSESGMKKFLSLLHRLTQ